MSQHELQEQIIHKMFWTGGERFFDRHVNHGMMLDAFPQLNSLPDFVTAGKAEPMELLALLFRAGDFEEAKSFFSRLVDAKPLDTDPTWVTSALARLSTDVITVMKAEKDNWPTSSYRDAYMGMIDISERLWCYAEQVYDNNLKHKSVQAEAFYLDIELYKKCIDHDVSKHHAFALHHWKCLLAPAKQGDFEFQEYLLDQLISQTKGKSLSKGDLDLGASYFWRDIWDDLSELGENKGKVLEKVRKVALGVFSPDNAQDIKKQLSSKRFNKVLFGTLRMVLEAKEEGLPMSKELYRAALRPLEKCASIAGRAWQGALTSEEWSDYREKMEQLLGGVDVKTLYPRKMSDVAVSVFAEVMPNCGWMEKASEKGRADILMEDLGL